MMPWELREVRKWRCALLVYHLCEAPFMLKTEFADSDEHKVPTLFSNQMRSISGRTYAIATKVFHAYPIKWSKFGVFHHTYPCRLRKWRLYGLCIKVTCLTILGANRALRLLRSDLTVQRLKSGGTAFSALSLHPLSPLLSGYTIEYATPVIGTTHHQKETLVPQCQLRHAWNSKHWRVYTVMRPQNLYIFFAWCQSRFQQSRGSIQGTSDQSSKMPSDKDRLYVALYARSGAAKMPGGEDKWVFLDEGIDAAKA